MAVSTIFAFIYIGAIEDNDIFLGPVHVYRMTEEQAAKRTPKSGRAMLLMF